jgi:hypothetical protein
MTTVRRWTWAPAGVGVIALLGVTLWAADPPKEELDRKPSTYAPAKDLEGQVQFFLDRVKEDLQSETEYSESSIQRVVRDANTLAVLALVLGKHDETNRYQAAASGLMQNALTLAEKAKQYSDAKAAYAKLLDSAQTPASGAAGDLQWKNVGSIVELMNQVPKINLKLRGQVRSSQAKRFEEARAEAAGLAATLSAIAQVSMFDNKYCSDQADQAGWVELCGMMRDAAFDVNQAVHQGDQAAAMEGLKPLQRTCDDCHAQFKN